MPAPYSADPRWRVIWFVMLSRGQLAVRKAVSVYRELKQTRRRRKRERHLKNVTSRFCNHLSIIQSHYAWKMRFNYPGIKLEPALRTRPNWTFVMHMLTSSTQLQKGSLHVIERTRRSSKCQKMKNARAKILFLLSNMPICGVFVAVVLAVA